VKVSLLDVDFDSCGYAVRSDIRGTIIIYKVNAFKNMDPHFQHELYQDILYIYTHKYLKIEICKDINVYLVTDIQNHHA
jgi:hypothetical protein